MHIVLVSRLSSHGGIAVYNRYLAHALVQQGHRVSLVTSRRSPDQPAVYNDNGATVYSLFTQHRYWLHRLPVIGYYMRSILKFLYSLRVARQLQALEVRNRPDIIEFAEAGGEGFVYLLRRQRCPVVVRCHTPTFVLRHYHTPEEMPYDTSLISAMEKYCIRHADALTAPSNDMARTIAQECGIPVERVRVIPNGLDVGLFASDGRWTTGGRQGTREQRSRASDDVIVLHVGRLERVKGIEVLVQAIPLVLQQVPRARFVFIGAAPGKQGTTWKRRLEAYCQEKGLQERLLFLGFLEQPAMVEWYHTADIAVVPTLNYESFSYTCAQAMAAGLPVVASHIGGIPETVDDGVSGLLVEPGNIAELTQALVTLAQDSDLRKRMGEAGQRKAHRSFDAPVVAEQIVQVYAATLKATRI